MGVVVPFATAVAMTSSPPVMTTVVLQQQRMPHPQQPQPQPQQQGQGSSVVMLVSTARKGTETTRAWRSTAST